MNTRKFLKRMLIQDPSTNYLNEKIPSKYETSNYKEANS